MGIPSSLASTLDVPPGRTASGTDGSLEAARGLGDRAVAAADRDDVEAARQEASHDLRRVARPARRRVDELEPALPLPVDQRAHVGAAVALPGGRVVDEQAALRAARAFRTSSPSRFGAQESQVAVRRGRGDAAARRALEEAGLEEVGLVEVLERAAVLAERGGDRADADGTAAELLDDRREDPPVELVEAVLVHLEARQRLARGLEVDLVAAGDLGEVAQAAQQAVGDARRAAAARADLARGLGRRCGSRGCRAERSTISASAATS